MASKVAIVNFALTKLGESQRISSLTDNTEPAKAANAIYEEVAKCVMAESTFSSTVRRANLSLTTTTPAFEYTYEYQLPANPVCLRVITINDTYPNTVMYAIEGDKLLTDSATCKLKYVAYLTDSEDYGPFLTQAIVYKLAAELCRSIMGDSGPQQLHMAAYEAYSQKMRSIDSMQGSNYSIESNPLTDIR